VSVFYCTGCDRYIDSDAAPEDCNDCLIPPCRGTELRCEGCAEGHALEAHGVEAES